MKSIYFFVAFFVAFLFGGLINAQNLVSVQGGAIFTPANDSAMANVVLTNPVQYSYGAAYLGAPQNLNNPINYEFDIFLGTDDNGADGLVFMLHNDSRGQAAHGDVGMGLGYASSPNTQDYIGGVSSNVQNSIAIEFDTYQNTSKGDPQEDHVALVYGGNNKHSDYPGNYLKKLSDIENGGFHRFRFSWDPTLNNVKVYFDNVLKINITIDIRVVIGSTVAYIGFSGTTGAMVNTQIVRDVASPLPVELADFSATIMQNQAAVQLDWLTLSETNNSHFTIERSLDGIRFEELGQLVGAGNSNSPLTYSFIDYNMPESIVYYRLLQTDFDGTNNYSQMVSVTPDGFNVENALISVATLEDALNINTLIAVPGKYSFQLFDISGKLISQQTQELNEGAQQTIVSLNQISSNQIVLLRIDNGGQWQTSRSIFIP